MTDDLYKATIPGNLPEGEKVQEFTIPKPPAKFSNPAAVLNHTLFLGAVKDAREFHCAMMKYRRLGRTKAAATARGTRRLYLLRARRYLDRALEFEAGDAYALYKPTNPHAKD